MMEYNRIKGFPSLLICFAFNFRRVIIFICYIGVDFKFGLLECVHKYCRDFVIPGLCSILL